MTIAQTLVESSGQDTNLIMDTAERDAMYVEQDFKEEKTFFYFIDNSGIVVHNDLVETF